MPFVHVFLLESTSHIVLLPYPAALRLRHVGNTSAANTLVSACLIHLSIERCRKQWSKHHNASPLLMENQGRIICNLHHLTLNSTPLVLAKITITFPYSNSSYQDLSFKYQYAWSVASGFSLLGNRQVMPSAAGAWLAWQWRITA